MVSFGSAAVIVLFPFEILSLWLFTLFIRCRDIFRIIFPGRPKCLEGEIILITGGANGIGQQLCFKIAEKETRLTIIIWDVNDQANSETVGKLRAMGLKSAFAFNVDVSNREQVADAAQRVRKEIGDVSMIFNNAGILGQMTDGWMEDPLIFEKVFGVNLFSHSWILREFLPKIIENGGGHIIVTCSVLGLVPSTSASAYAASKFGVRGFMESMKEDLRHHPMKPKISFTTAYPDLVMTNMTDGIDMKTRRYKFLRSALTPEYVAQEILRGVLLEMEHVYVPRRHRFGLFLMDISPPEVIRKFYDWSGFPLLHVQREKREV